MGIGEICPALAGQTSLLFSYENETVNHVAKPSQDGRNGGTYV